MKKTRELTLATDLNYLQSRLEQDVIEEEKKYEPLRHKT